MPRCRWPSHFFAFCALYDLLTSARVKTVAKAQGGDGRSALSKASKRLTEIHAALAAQGHELTSFDAALKAAADHLAAAQAVESQAHAREAASLTGA
jgi:hypothetical protein